MDKHARVAILLAPAIDALLDVADEFVISCERGFPHTTSYAEVLEARRRLEKFVADMVP